MACKESVRWFSGKFILTLKLTRISFLFRSSVANKNYNSRNFGAIFKSRKKNSSFSTKCKLKANFKWVPLCSCFCSRLDHTLFSNFFLSSSSVRVNFCLLVFPSSWGFSLVYYPHLIDVKPELWNFMNIMDEVEVFFRKSLKIDVGKSRICEVSWEVRLRNWESLFRGLFIRDV